MADEQNPLFGTGDPWALEETQSQLLSSLDSYIKNNAKKDTKNIEDIKKGIQGLYKEGSAAQKASVAELKNMSSQAKEGANLQKKIWSTIGGKAVGVGKGLLNFGGSLKELAVVGGSLGFGLGALAGIAADNVDMYQDLIGVGQTFGGNMLDMNRAAAQAGLTLDTFAKTVKANSKVMAYQSDTLGDGLSAFMNTQKVVRQFTHQFSNFGLRVEEITEHTGIYMEQLRVQGRLERMTQNQLRIGTANYLKQLTELAVITGKSREQLSQEMAQASKDLDVFTVGLQFSGETREDFFHAIETMSSGLRTLSADSQESIRKLISAYVSEYNVMENAPLGATLRAMVPEVADALATLGETVKNGGDGTGEATAHLIGTIKNLDEAQVRSIVLRAQHGDDEARQVVRMLQEARGIRINAEKETAKALASSAAKTNEEFATAVEQSAVQFNEATKSLLTFDSRMKITIGELKEVIIDGLEPAVENLSKHLGTLTTNIQDMVKNNKEVLQEFAKSIGQAGGSLTEDLGTLGVAVAGATGTYLGIKGVTAARGLKGGAKVAGVVGEEATEGILKKGASSVGKGMAKSLWKKIPFLGALIALGFAADRLMEGDATGAGLEVASGGAAIFPGLGTAASVGIDATLIARDIAKAQGEMESTATARSDFTPKGSLGRFNRIGSGSRNEILPESIESGIANQYDEERANTNKLLGDLLKSTDEQNRILADIAGSNRDTAKHSKDARRAVGDDLTVYGP